MKYLAIENIKKGIAEDLGLGAELGVEGLSSSSILLSIREVTQDIEATEGVADGIMKASSL